MKNRWLAVLALGAVLVAPALSRADVGFIKGVPTDPTCGATATLDDTTANLLAFNSVQTKQSSDIIYSIKGGTIKRGFPSFTTGNWSLTKSNFVPSPSSATDTVFVMVTTYDPTAMTAHKGLMTVDNYAATKILGHREVLQPLQFFSRPAPFNSTNPGPGKGTSGATTGFDVRWRPVGEFQAVDGGTPETNPNCRWGGDATPSFAHRIIAGYNVYRLQGIATTTSTPAHYLGGADMNFSTRNDNGWVGFISLDPANGRMDLDAAGGTDLNTAGDLFGIQADAGNPALLIFSDAPRAPNGTANPYAITDFSKDYTYAFQPVVKATAPLAQWDGGGAWVTDGDGNTVMDSIDLPDSAGVRDGNPDFIDPSGTGLGLTFQGASGGTMILLSTDSAATSSQTLPAEGAIMFGGDYADGVFNLRFSASLQTSIAGFNIWRSTKANDASSFLQVNKNLIVADSSALNQYNYQDAVPQARRMARGVYYYKVDVVYLDGSTRSFGPYEINFTGVSSPRGR